MGITGRGDSCAFATVIFPMDDTQGVASPQSLSQCIQSSCFRWEAHRLEFVGTTSGILICGRAGTDDSGLASIEHNPHIN